MCRDVSGTDAAVARDALGIKGKIEVFGHLHREYAIVCAGIDERQKIGEPRPVEKPDAGAPTQARRVLCGKGISQERGKITLVGGDDLDEHGFGEAPVFRLLSGFAERLSGGHHLTLVRRKRNPARWVRLEEIAEIRDWYSLFYGCSFHSLIV
jgi:hypothetical protein